MPATKEHILREIRRLAEDNDGVPVGGERFEAATGITEAEWSGRYWARWNDAVREAGLEPNAWRTREHDDNALIRMLADVTRDLDRFPTIAELRMWRRTHPGLPNAKTFYRLGSKAEQHAKVLAFALADETYQDVATICESTAPRSAITKSAVGQDRVVTGVVYLIQMGEYYKIGRSNDVGRRGYELSIQLPEKHLVIHVIDTDDPSGVEAYWHRRFASQRANGEWFRLAPGDVAAFTRRTYM